VEIPIAFFGTLIITAILFSKKHKSCSIKNISFLIMYYMLFGSWYIFKGYGRKTRMTNKSKPFTVCYSLLLTLGWINKPWVCMIRILGI